MQTFVGAFDGEPHILPWAERLKVPDYKEFKRGQWELTNNSMPPMLRGYYTDIHIPDHPTNPVLKKGNNVWMSVTPMELESQAPHAHFAHGTTVVGGLGMGVVLYNIAMKPEVDEVIVVEKDKHVISLFDNITEWGRWEGFDKIRIVQGDIETISFPEMEIDFVCVDTFQKMMSRENLEVLQKVRRNMNPGLMAGWTTELEFVDWLREQDITPSDVTDDDYMTFCDEYDLNLIYWEGISQYCLTVGYHTSMY